jgi:hypothetical protein
MHVRIAQETPVVSYDRPFPTCLKAIKTAAPRPGGNATGLNLLTSELTAKRLELVRQLLPLSAFIYQPQANAISAMSCRSWWQP